VARNIALKVLVKVIKYDSCVSSFLGLQKGMYDPSHHGIPVLSSISTLLPYAVMQRLSGSYWYLSAIKS
jgi:hypothetical protein